MAEPKVPVATRMRVYGQHCSMGGDVSIEYADDDDPSAEKRMLDLLDNWYAMVKGLVTERYVRAPADQANHWTAETGLDWPETFDPRWNLDNLLTEGVFPHEQVTGFFLEENHPVMEMIRRNPIYSYSPADMEKLRLPGGYYRVTPFTMHNLCTKIRHRLAGDKSSPQTKLAWPEIDESRWNRHNLMVEGVVQRDTFLVEKDHPVIGLIRENKAFFRRSIDVDEIKVDRAQHDIAGDVLKACCDMLKDRLQERTSM